MFSCAGAVEQELRELFGYACPTVTTMVMFYLANVVTMAFVGQLGPVDLAAGGLATMFCNVCSYQSLSCIQYCDAVLCCDVPHSHA